MLKLDTGCLEQIEHVLNVHIDNVKRFILSRL